MNFPAAPTRVIAALARLDDFELRGCMRFNRIAHRTGWLRVFQVASRAGDGVLWYSLVGALALLGGEEGRATALVCAVAGISGLAIYRALKSVLVRERPFIRHESIVCAGRPLDRFSFPSGHTLHAVCFTVIVAQSFPLVGLALLPAVIAIALSRVVLGLHYPSDVLAGGLLGAGIAEAAMAVMA